MKSLEQLANRFERAGHAANVISNVGKAAFWINFLNVPANEFFPHNPLLTLGIPAVIGLIGFFSRETLNKIADEYRLNSDPATTPGLHNRMIRRQKVIKNLAILPIVFGTIGTLQNVIQPQDAALVAEGIVGGAVSIVAIGTAMKNGSEARAISERLNFRRS